MATRITPPPALAAALAAHRAAASGDGRADDIPTRFTLNTGLAPGTYHVSPDGTLTKQDER